MNRDKLYYQEWRGIGQDSQQTDEFSESVNKFFAADEFQPIRQLPPHRQQRMEEIKMRTTNMFNRSERLHNPDKKQVGIFYDNTVNDALTKEDRMDISRKSHQSDTIFRPNTYMNGEWKEHVNKTTAQAEHNEGQYIGDKPDKKHNFQRTVISEYSNALNNQTVFINPRFMSC